MSLPHETSLFLQQLSTNSISDSFLIGKGTERTCFFLPEHPNVVLKISKKSLDKQTRREINYFRFLTNKKVPFSHISQFFQEIKTQEYHGFLQERILNTDGNPSPTLYEYIKHHQDSKKEILMMLKEFFRYLYRYNIIPCDLRLDNLLVQTTQTENKLIAVDGLGSTDAINIAQYLPCWGHKKIIRKIIFFLTNHPENLSLFDNPQEINHWVNTEILSSK